MEIDVNIEMFYNVFFLLVCKNNYLCKNWLIWLGELLENMNCLY